MEPNPYQSPTAAQFRWAQARAMLDAVSRFELVVLGGLILFLMASIGHRCQLIGINDANVTIYTRSPLIAVEAIGMLGSLAIIPVLLLRSIYLFIQKRVVA